MTPLEAFLIACLAFYCGLRLRNTARDAEIRLLRTIIVAGAENEQQASGWVEAQREASPWQ